MRSRPAGVILLLALALSGACRSQDPPPETDWNAVATQLQAQLDELRADETLDRDARDSNLALAGLEIERLQLRHYLPWRGAAWEAEQADSRTACLDALARARAGQVGHRGQTGGETPDNYFTRAYFCRTDESPQPYHLRLPDNYSDDREWPLIIFLHGYVLETSKIEPWVLAASQWSLAPSQGMIFCLPHGRRNSDFLGIGEVDVLRVIEEMQRWYRIDPERIYLTGCSMGGYGGWAIGLRHPDRFAALALMSGQTDFFVWERRERDEVRFKSWCILQNNPIDLAGNARSLPMHLQHGEFDNLVPTEHSRLIAPVMERLGYDFRYEERAGLGHYLYWEDEPLERMFAALDDHRRAAAPPRVSFTTYTTKYGRAYWADLRAFHRKAEPASIDAEVGEQGVTATCRNVAELWLDLPEALRRGEPAVTVNGQAAGRLGAGPHRITIDAEGRPSPAEPGQPGPPPLMGPMREVFNAPFIAVVGTGGSDADRAHNRARAEAFRTEWWQFAEGLAPLAFDRDLTAEQVAGRNLVIFGEPGTVTLPGIADPAATLPRGVTLQRGRYTFGEKVYQGDELGCFLLVPHPLRAGGLICWSSGEAYGAALPYNHKYDLIPELLVYHREADWDGCNKFLLGGFLGWDWQLDWSLLEERPGPA